MKHVLVVDDDDGIRQLLRECLEDEGYTVHLAVDGLEALTFLRAAIEKVIVLLDIRMPKMDGISMLFEIGQDEILRTKHRYAVVSGAVYQLERMTPGRLSSVPGFDHVLIPVVVKPFEIDSLIDLIHRLESMKN